MFEIGSLFILLWFWLLNMFLFCLDFLDVEDLFWRVREEKKFGLFLFLVLFIILFGFISWLLFGLNMLFFIVEKLMIIDKFCSEIVIVGWEFGRFFCWMIRFWLTSLCCIIRFWGMGFEFRFVYFVDKVVSDWWSGVFEEFRVFFCLDVGWYWLVSRCSFFRCCMYFFDLLLVIIIVFIVWGGIWVVLFDIWIWVWLEELLEDAGVGSFFFG